MMQLDTSGYEIAGNQEISTPAVAAAILQIFRGEYELDYGAEIDVALHEQAVSPGERDIEHVDLRGNTVVVKISGVTYEIEVRRSMPKPKKPVGITVDGRDL